MIIVNGTRIASLSWLPSILRYNRWNEPVFCTDELQENSGYDNR